MKNLYPLKFNPIYKDKIWGGQKIKTELDKNYGTISNCGESWEISGVQDNISIICNGFLKDNNLEELVEIYMGDLVGDRIFKKFGLNFPLLIKFIDANDDLSIQVHPNDELAKKRNLPFGKTEMWYVLNANKGAKLNCGFNQPMTKEKYLDKLNSGKIMDILNFTEVKAGDVFFVPAGRVHSIGKGILLAEIQQTSDATYRIYDYNRKDTHGNTRELHTKLALDAFDFTFHKDVKTNYNKELNKSSKLISCSYFTTNLLEFDKTIEKDIYHLDSFVIYMCTEGEYKIEYNDTFMNVKKGETVLIPASLYEYKLIPSTEKVKLLEIHL